MKILVIGAGGREHALVRSLLRHAVVQCSPGNDGIARDCPCIPLADELAIIQHCQREEIDLVVIGPEQPLVDGLADALRHQGIAVFGPSAAAAQVEASKEFTKKLCDRMGIPTARYASFTDAASALEYLAKHGAPIVVKADGLAAGKGVTVALTHEEAARAITECFAGAFGAAGSRVVLEEMLEGEEVSFFALSDGITAIPFASAQDHKRAFDGDEGPNTGGMGAYSPAPVFTEALQQQAFVECILPAIAGLREMGMPYVGVLFAGLMLTNDGPKLIEFNARFGDPETQVMLARFSGNLAQLLYSCAVGAIDASHLSFADSHAMCVVMAAKGYPAAYAKGTPIHGIENQAAHILHAGTKLHNGQWQSNGGRVLNVMGTGKTLREARDCAYKVIDSIDWPEGFCRRDIGFRASVGE